MNHDQLNYSLLARYLSGGCNEREREIIEQWRGRNSENEKMMAEFKRIWDTAAQKEGTSEKDNRVDGEWEKLKTRLVREGELRDDTKQRSVYSDKLQTSSVHSPARQIMRVAALLLVAALLGFLSYQYLSHPRPVSQEQVFREISTEKGQRASSTLGDGTQVLLNADSRIRLPSEFASDLREVFLEGEAYFDVISDRDKPFVIHSGESVVRVLGTSFSVRSYPGEDTVQVVVEEGRVSFEAELSPSPQKAILEASELGRYSLQSKKIETRRVDDMQLHLGWKEGYLKFREASMGKVAIELERRYGVEVSFRSPAVKEMTLTALLKSRSIRNVLDVIAMSLDIGYELDQDNVIFYQE